MQMTPDQYADYIADGSKYAKHGVRWQFLRDRAKKVIDLFRPKKVTKAELEKALTAAAREEFGYDVVPGPTRKRCLLAAMKVLGLEVEE